MEDRWIVLISCLIDVLFFTYFKNIFKIFKNILNMKIEFFINKKVLL